MRARIARVIAPFRVFLSAGAWFFIVLSFFMVMAAAAVKWEEPQGTYKLYHTVVDGHSRDAWGLTYTGVPGLLAAILEASVVASAALGSCLRAPRLLRLRRAAHLALLGWAVLWAWNLLWLTSIDHEVDSAAQAALMCVLLGCTGGRALLGWSPPRRDGRGRGGTARSGTSPPRPGSDLPSERLGAPVIDDRFDRVLRAGLEFASRSASPAAAPVTAPPAAPARGFVRSAAARLSALWSWARAQAPGLLERLGALLRSLRALAAGALRRAAGVLRRQAKRLAPAPQRPCGGE
jgi:hypothetical protein